MNNVAGIVQPTGCRESAASDAAGRIVRMGSTSLAAAFGRPARTVPATAGATHAVAGGPVVGRPATACGRSGALAVAFPG